MPGSQSLQFNDDLKSARAVGATDPGRWDMVTVIQQDPDSGLCLCCGPPLKLACLWILPYFSLNTPVTWIDMRDVRLLCNVLTRCVSGLGGQSAVPQISSPFALAAIGPRLPSLDARVLPDQATSRPSEPLPTRRWTLASKAIIPSCLFGTGYYCVESKADHSSWSSDIPHDPKRSAHRSTSQISDV